MDANQIWCTLPHQEILVTIGPHNDCVEWPKDLLQRDGSQFPAGAMALTLNRPELYESSSACIE